MSDLIGSIILDLHFDEGKVAYVYDDATKEPIRKGSYVRGNPTIGVGRNLADNPLSDDEIAYLLNNDIARILIWCNTALSWFGGLDDVRKRAIINMVFQLGISHFLRFRFFMEAMQRKDYEQAFGHGKNSLWYEQTPIRAARILQMIRTGHDH